MENLSAVVSSLSDTQLVTSPKNKKGSGRPHDDIDFSPRKKIRSQSPDVTVVVGSGSSAREYHCYKLILSFASEYFDAMFSAGMKEDEESRIEFPHKDPKEWEQFYDFIDPSNIGQCPTAGKINEKNVNDLLPWFHEFQMKSYLSECDKVILNLFMKEDKHSQLTDKATRKNFFDKCIKILECACKFDLDKTCNEIGGWVARLMQLPSSNDLFDLPAMKSLVPLVLPLESCDDWLASNGLCKCLWFSFKTVLAPHVLSLSIDLMNNPEVLSQLAHAYTQQRMMKDMAASYKRQAYFGRNNYVKTNDYVKPRETVASEAPTEVNANNSNGREGRDLGNRNSNRGDSVRREGDVGERRVQGVGGVNGLAGNDGAIINAAQRGAAERGDRNDQLRRRILEVLG